MISTLSLLCNCNMIFRLKNGSSRRLFLTPQVYTWRGSIHVDTPVIQSEMCWFILSLNSFVLSPIVSQYMFLFRYKFYISNNMWHFQFLCEFPKLDHYTLWIYWSHLNNFDKFYIFYHCIHKFWFSNVFEIWCESKSDLICQFSIQMFGLFQRHYEILIFIYRFKVFIPYISKLVFQFKTRNL